MRSLALIFLGLAALAGQAPAQSSVPALQSADPSVAPGLSDAFVTSEPEDARLYASGEYLVWWLRRGHIPPLLTTSSTRSRGELGQPDTRVLFGDERLETRHNDRFVGGRLVLGWFMNEDRTVAVEGTAFFLERDSTYFKTVSGGDILLARPFFNALDGSATSEIIAGPTVAGVRTGGFNGYSRVELFGQELNAVARVADGPGGKLEFLAGARFLQMRDRLDLTATGRLLPDLTTLYGLTDHFRVHNAFYGGQLGVRAEKTWGRWSAELRGTAALGGNDELVRTFGDRLFQTPLRRDVQTFGLAVLPSNTGRFERCSLDAVYDVGANLSCRLGDHTRLFGGYTFLLWTSPLRAGDQVDLFVNPTQLGGQLNGPARPVITFRQDAFWAHGLSVGLEFRW